MHFFLLLILGCALFDGIHGSTFNTVTLDGDSCICTTKNDQGEYQKIRGDREEKVSSALETSSSSVDRNELERQEYTVGATSQSEPEPDNKIDEDICERRPEKLAIRPGSSDDVSLQASGSGSGQIITSGSVLGSRSGTGLGSGSGLGSNSLSSMKIEGASGSATGGTIKTVSVAGTGTGSSSLSGSSAGIGIASGINSGTIRYIPKEGIRTVKYNRNLGNAQARTEVVSSNMGGYKTSSGGWYGKYKRYRGGNGHGRQLYGTGSGYPSANRFDY